MAKPWERYQNEPAGPWQKFKDSAPGRAGVIGSRIEESGEGEESSLLEKATTGSRSFLEGMTLGLSEPVIGGATAVLGASIDEGAELWDKARGKEPSDDKAFLDRVSDDYASQASERRRMKRENPLIDVGGQISGAIVPAIATGGESLLVNAGRMAPTVGRAAQVGKILDLGGTVASGATKAAGAVGKLLPGASKLASVSNPIIKGAVAIGKGGASGAAGAGASEVVRQGILKNTGYMEEGEGPSITDAMTTGMKWGAGLSSLPQAYKASKYLAKRGMSVALGPKVEVIDAYLANAERIRKAPTVEAIKDEMDTLAAKLQDDVDAGKLSVEEAKKVHEAVVANIADVRKEATHEFRNQKFEAARDFDNSKAAFDDQVAGQKSALQTQGKMPDHIAHNVNASIHKLKKQVVDGSNAAMEILENTQGQIDFRGPWKQLHNLRDSLNIKGGARTSTVKAAQAKIQEMIDDMGSLPSQLDYASAKRLMKQLDALEAAAYGSTEFDSAYGAAVKTLRSAIDRQVKEQVPEYAQAMQLVAEQAKLLNKLQSRFGDTQATIGRLRSIHRPESRLDYDDLAALGSATGDDFIPQIDEVVTAQRKLGNPQELERLAAGTPEYAAMKAKEARIERMAHPDTGRDFVEGAVKTSGLLDDEAAAMQRLNDAEAKFQSAKSRQEPFRGITEQSSQGKIEALMRERDPIHTRRQVEALDGEFGSNLTQKIDDRRVLDSFEKGNTNGSRNVNLFSIMGHSFGVGAGTMAGAGAAMFGPVGLFAGGVAGAVVDKYGPQMAKGVLDAVLKIEGNPTLQKIQSLNLPPDVKNYLSAQFVRHQGSVIRGERPVPRAVGIGELDTDSSSSSNYIPDDESGNQNEARDRFLKGN